MTPNGDLIEEILEKEELHCPRMRFVLEKRFPQESHDITYHGGQFSDGAW